MATSTSFFKETCLFSLVSWLWSLLALRSSWTCGWGKTKQIIKKVTSLENGLMWHSWPIPKCLTIEHGSMCLWSLFSHSWLWIRCKSQGKWPGNHIKWLMFRSYRRLMLSGWKRALCTSEACHVKTGLAWAWDKSCRSFWMIKMEKCWAFKLYRPLPTYLRLK